MPDGAVWVLMVPAQNGPVLEIAQVGTGNTASVDIERSMLPRLPKVQLSRRMWYEEPLIPPAERGVPLALKPQSQRQAMWPPQASTTRGLVAVKRTRTWVSEDFAVGSPSVT